MFYHQVLASTEVEQLDMTNKSDQFHLIIYINYGASFSATKNALVSHFKNVALKSSQFRCIFSLLPSPLMKTAI